MGPLGSGSPVRRGSPEGQASAASSTCISAALPPLYSSRLIVPASHQRRSPGDSSKAWPSSVAALRKTIHLKLLPSSPHASPRTWPLPTMLVLSSRVGPAATCGLGQPAPYGPAASRASHKAPETPP